MSRAYYGWKLKISTNYVSKFEVKFVVNPVSLRTDTKILLLFLFYLKLKPTPDWKAMM